MSGFSGSSHDDDDVVRLRRVVEKARRECLWALASLDPHDWKKGLSIIETDLDRELTPKDQRTP